MLFATESPVITEKVVLELIAFLSLLATNIFNMWQNSKLSSQNKDLKNQLSSHEEHAKTRTADIATIKQEIAECKGELCKPKQ